MKKLIALILAAMFCLGLAACGEEPAAEDDTPASEAPASDAPEAEEPSGDPVELTVWLPIYQFGDGISDADFWNGKFDAFEEENNCTINLEILSWTDYAPHDDAGGDDNAEYEQKWLGTKYLHACAPISSSILHRVHSGSPMTL